MRGSDMDDRMDDVEVAVALVVGAEVVSWVLLISERELELMSCWAKRVS